MAGMRRCFFLLTFLNLCSCSSLYVFHQDEIDQSSGSLFPFNIKVSQLGLNPKDMSSANVLFSSDEVASRFKALALLLSLSNMGPKTGLPVFSFVDANQLLDYLMLECPTGEITGLSSIRESISYIFFSKEIIAIKGFCKQSMS